MINVEKTVMIHKPVEEVFNFVTAEGNYAKWQAGVAEVIEGGGSRNAVGTQFTEIRKFMGQEMRTTLEITAFEPNVKWAAKVVKGPVPYEVTVTYEASDGGTKFTTRVEGEPTGFSRSPKASLPASWKRALLRTG